MDPSPVTYIRLEGEYTHGQLPSPAPNANATGSYALNVVVLQAPIIISLLTIAAELSIINCTTELEQAKGRNASHQMLRMMKAVTGLDYQILSLLMLNIHQSHSVTVFLCPLWLPQFKLINLVVKTVSSFLLDKYLMVSLV